MNHGGKKERKVKPLSRDQWINAARELLIAQGVAGLSLRQICARLNVTTGAFYWLFDTFDALLDALRNHWATTNSAAFDKVFSDPRRDGYDKYLGYVRVLLAENEYDPNYDNAMRDWAHSSRKTADAVRRVDSRRIGQLARMFSEIGYERRPAVVRARTTYFHQSGYYRMGIVESLDERLINVPYYAEILVGKNFISPNYDLEETRRVLFGAADDKSSST